MYIGNLLLALTFASCVIALTGYFLGTIGKKKFTSLGRRAYLVFTILSIALAGLLLSQILAHNFQLEYVHSYSSSDLPFHLLLSTFWAGQVGTFVLWLLLTALIGLVIWRRSDPDSSTVMFYYMLSALFLLVLLAARSPFKLLPFVPTEGSGLNPLLRNFWMIIHPPVVFVGFALMAVPFSYAMAALTRHDYSGWVRNSLPWVLTSSAVLGLGIFLGGYWAYETLGWGGYWAWDPVENASLIPWLTNLALAHGLIIERKYGQLRKSNLLLAAFGFLLIIYGTFLTRSGVLADFSVHSFTDLGMNIYLVAFLLIVLVVIVVFFAMRFRRIKALKKIEDPVSIDFLTAVGMLFLIGLAVLTLVGTSSPLITRLPMFSAPANVGVDYYNRIALPIGIMIALLAGFVPLLRIASSARVLRECILPASLGAVGVIVGYIVGIETVRHSLLVFFSVFAISANVRLLVSGRRMRRLGVDLAHMGFGLLLIGFLASSVFVVKEKAALTIDTPRDVLGYSLTYRGIEGDQIHVDVEADGSSFRANPKLYFDSYTRSTMREPHIRSFLAHDLYIAPEGIDTSPPGEVLILSEGESKTSSGWNLTFNGFDLSAHDDAAMQVGADVTAVKNGDTLQIAPTIAMRSDGQREYESTNLGSSDMIVSLDDVNPAQKTVALRLHRPDQIEQATLDVEISIVPLIILVWLGALLVLIGTVIALYQRLQCATPKSDGLSKL